MGQSTVKKSKPDFHLTISSRSSNQISNFLKAFKAKMFTVPSPDDCPWQGCTVSHVSHTHLFPQDVASEVNIKCPVLNCFNWEPHSHPHTPAVRKRLHDYHNSLAQDHAKRVLAVIQLERQKSNEQISEELMDAQQSPWTNVAWSPYDVKYGLAFELELLKIQSGQASST